MNCTVILNWKSFAALGLSAIGIILVTKMNSNQAMEVSTHAIDAYREIGSRKIAG